MFCFAKGALDDILYCWMIEDADGKWSVAIDSMVENIKSVDNIGVAELYLTEFFESMLLFILDGTASIMPIFTSLAGV